MADVQGSAHLKASGDVASAAATVAARNER